MSSAAILKVFCAFAIDLLTLLNGKVKLKRLYPTSNVWFTACLEPALGCSPLCSIKLKWIWEQKLNSIRLAVVNQIIKHFFNLFYAMLQKKIQQLKINLKF